MAESEDFVEGQSASTKTGNFIDTNLTELEGLRAYTQETLENEVSRQLDDEISTREREREISNLKIELKQVEKDILKYDDGLKSIEKRLQELCSAKVFVNSRKCQALLDEQEKLKIKHAEAKVLKEEILKELKKFETKTTKVNSTEELALVKAEIASEPEEDKNIRLGNLTAFGSALKSELKSSGNFEAYWKRLQEEQAGEESSDDEARKRKQKVGSSQKRPCPKSKRLKGEEDDRESKWNTDDSDWETSSNDEAEAATKRRKRKLRSSSIGGKIIDDGNKDDYIDRLECWHESRSQEEISDGEKFQELEGGLKVPLVIWKKLYHYQKVAVQWLWELHQQKAGGILADEMGLGKTIQIISFLASMSFSHSYKKKHNDKSKRGPTSLIVCPTTVMQQWVGEFHTWWPPLRVTILHESGSFQGSKSSLIQSAAQSQGVLVTSYGGLVTYKDDLIGQNFDYIILDEGHKIRNPDAQITLAVKKFTTCHRIILSGSPLQNNLKELWSLFDFIFPGRLGTLPVFMENFSIPITMGGYANASRTQVATAYKCATILRDTINPYLLRRMKSDVRDHLNLPEKNEQVLFCRLTDEQRDLYRQYLHSPEVKQIFDGRFRVFVGLINLRKICNHPDLYDGKPQHIRLAPEDAPNVFDDPNSEDFGYWKRSGKMIVVESLLKLWKSQGHKVLLFTQSRQMLKVLEKFVRHAGYSFSKLDGTTAIGSRQSLIDKFNRSDDIFVFLLTTKVGGLGVNLTGANRVIIFDPDWNPSTDIQSRERAWRIGQSRDVTIYRLLTSGTIEEKIYHRQIFKQLLINRVLKDPAMQRRFFKSSDLHDLFSLNEGTSDKTESSAIFAGTNSEVRPKKRRGKSNHLSDSREKSEKVYSVKIERPKLKDNSKLISKLIGRDDNDDEKRRDKDRADKEKEKPKREERSKRIDLDDEHRKKLMEKVRQINLKFQQKGESTSHRDVRKEKKRRKGAKFEGNVRVSHLDKCRTFVPVAIPDEEQPESDKKQNDYVLSRLFKKSGVHSALQHDVIVDGGDSDYILVEAEAERVAKEAVQKLKLSRRQCFPAEAGVPTWTGTNGSVVPKTSKPRFGKIPKKSKTSAPITAHELLQRMKRRSLGGAADNNLFRPDNMTDDIELLTEIRNFVAFQANSAGEGEATTAELLEKFQKKLPPQQSPLFKALLTEICTFQRHHLSNKGVWRLKDEFR